jgi:hypothetical protein
MTELVNLRRMRKAKARAEAAVQAEANRAKHGVSKRERDLVKPQNERQRRAVEGHQLKDRDA